MTILKFYRQNKNILNEKLIDLLVLIDNNSLQHTKKVMLKAIKYMENKYKL